MKEKGLEHPNHHYRSEYAKLYLEKTLLAHYSVVKSTLLADMASKFNAHTVLDLGSNVHGSVKIEGSLRFQMNKKGIDYVGLDLFPEYFDKKFLKEQGVPEEKIYQKINGIVGDILNLPIESNSTEMAVCADVLEHTSDPFKAIKEIHRILKTQGIALIILPSLYKLDMADFYHIKERRKSSHLKKTAIDEWISMCEKNNFSVDMENSLPIGIAPGLSYLSWIDENFIPERKDLSSANNYSLKSIFHRNAKNIFSKYSEQIDAKINSSNLDQSLVEELKKGNLKKVFEILNAVSFEIVPEEEREALSDFFKETSGISYNSDRIKIIQEIFRNSKFPKLLLGSSVLLTLKKKD